MGGFFSKNPGLKNPHGWCLNYLAWSHIFELCNYGNYYLNLFLRKAPKRSYEKW